VYYLGGKTNYIDLRKSPWWKNLLRLVEKIDDESKQEIKQQYNVFVYETARYPPSSNLNFD